MASLEELMDAMNRGKRMEELESSPAPAVYDHFKDMGMDPDRINRFIDYLLSESQKKDLQLSQKESKLNEKEVQLAKLQESIDQLVRQVEGQTKELKELSKLRSDIKKYLKRIKQLEEQLAEARTQRYGSRQQTPKPKSSKKDDKDRDDDDKGDGPLSGDTNRTENQDTFDGTQPKEDLPERRQKEGINPSATGRTFNVENRPECYRTMGLNGLEAKHVTLKCDLSRLPEGAQVVDSREVEVYDMKVVLSCVTMTKVRIKFPGQKRARWMFLPKKEDEKYLPVAGTKATPAFMQALAYEVYMKGVTRGALHRQLKDFGMSISRNTLNNWLRKGKKLLDKVVAELKEVALEKDSILNCDETWCKVRYFNRYSRKYVWVLVNKSSKVVIFFYDEGSRGRKVLTDFLGEAELKAIMTDGYNAYNFLDGRLEVDHLICMAHARAKFIKALNQGGDEMAGKFIELFDRLYGKEREYKKMGYSPQRILLERQSPETGLIERKLRGILSKELGRCAPERGPYMQEALNYFDHFKEGLFLYRTNGEYPIDNNLAERNVRHFAAVRKSILHFGSGGGAEMAAVYHTIINTVQIRKRSVWTFFGDFFLDMVTGGDSWRAALNPAAV